MLRPGAKFFMLRNRGIVDPAAGGQILDSTGATFNRGDFTSGNAFFWSSINFGWYAGAYPGSTQFFLELTDGANKKSTGYLAGVGAGETLVEKISDPGFDAPGDWTLESGWSITGSNLVALDASSIAENTVGSSTIANGLYLVSFNIIAIAGGYVSLEIDSGGAGPVFNSAGVQTYYLTPISTGKIGLMRRFSNITGSFDSLSVKHITDPPSTGLHVVSSLNGTTRGWASIESGFDPNTITSWKIKGY